MGGGGAQTLCFVYLKHFHFSRYARLHDVALDGEATLHPLEVPQHGIAFLQSGYVGEGKKCT